MNAWHLDMMSELTSHTYVLRDLNFFSSHLFLATIFLPMTLVSGWRTGSDAVPQHLHSSVKPSSAVWGTLATRGTFGFWSLECAHCRTSCRIFPHLLVIKKRQSCTLSHVKHSCLTFCVTSTSTQEAHIKNEEQMVLRLLSIVLFFYQI